jgi:hypothetical protein
MTKKVDPDLTEMTAQLHASGDAKGRRSPLFRWMFRRASEFRQMLDDTHASWDAIATAASSLGLKDGAGKLPTAERVRKTWFEVRRVKGWTKQSPPEPAAAPVPAPAPARKPRAVEDDAEPPPARTFNTAVLRNHVPSAVPPALPAQQKPQPEPDPDRASRVIEALMSGAPRNKFRTDDGE